MLRDLVPQGFRGSNPLPRTTLLTYRIEIEFLWTLPLFRVILKYFVNALRDGDGHEELLVGNDCHARCVNVTRSQSSVSSSVLQR